MFILCVNITKLLFVCIFIKFDFFVKWVLVYRDGGSIFYIPHKNIDKYVYSDKVINVHWNFKIVL